MTLLPARLTFDHTTGLVASGATAAPQITDDGTWSGPIGYIGTWTRDGFDHKRMLAPKSGELTSGTLPLPALVQWTSLPGHEGAEMGLATLDKVEIQDDKIIGSGRIDLEDPKGAALARKIKQGFVRLTSVDLDPRLKAKEVCIQGEGFSEIADASCRETGYLVEDWQIMGVTIVAFPALEHASIELAAGPESPVTEDDGELADCVKQGPDGTWIEADCDDPDAVPNVSDKTDSATPEQLRDDYSTFAVSASLPWAPKDTTWDGDAAKESLFAWAGKGEDGLDETKLAQGFLIKDGDGQNRESWKFPVARVTDGKLELVWAGVTAAKAALNGARSETTASPEAVSKAKADLAKIEAAGEKEFGGEDNPPEKTSGSGDKPMVASAALVAERSHTNTYGTPIAGHAGGYDGAVTAWATPKDPGWFDKPDDLHGPASLPTPKGLSFSPDRPRIVVYPDGRLVGYTALWSNQHLAFDGRRMPPPRSTPGYPEFHRRAVRVGDGAMLLGEVVMNTSHSPESWSVRRSLAHYENTGAKAALVRAGEDAYGIWIAGAVRDHLTPEQIADLQLTEFSGDWRTINGRTEMVMSLAVNLGGFIASAAPAEEDCGCCCTGETVPAPEKFSAVKARIIAADLAHRARRPLENL